MKMIREFYNTVSTGICTGQSQSHHRSLCTGGGESNFLCTGDEIDNLFGPLELIKV